VKRFFTLAAATFAPALTLTYLIVVRGYGWFSGAYFKAGDYAFDADPALRLAMDGRPWLMYSTDPAPLMLPVGLLARVPALLAADAAGLIEGLNDRLVVGSIAALIIATGAILIGGWPRSRSPAAASGLGVVCAAFLLAPLTASAVSWGHAEEVLGAGLLLGALLAAQRERWVVAVAFAGLAALTKQPFLLAMPAFVLMVPQRLRLRLCVAPAALAAVVGLLLLAPHLPALIEQQLTQLTSSGEQSLYVQNLFSAVGIEHLGGLGRPTALLACVALPVLLARRSGWQLTAAQGAATAAIALVLRCLLDPYNIDYYALPAAAAMLAVDWVRWHDEDHPLRRLPVFVPIFGFAGGWLIWAGHVGPITETVDVLVGSANGKDYLLVCALLIAALTPTATGRRIALSRGRLGLYGVAAGVGCVLILAAHVVGRDTAQADTIAPPGGYTPITPTQAAALAGGKRIWWLGEGDGQSMRLRVVAQATSTRVVGYGQAGYVEYGPADHPFAATTVMTRRAGSALADAALRTIRRCRSGSCGRGWVYFTGGFGEAVWRSSSTGWEALVAVQGAQAVYVDSTQGAPERVLGSLRPIGG
jgi:hypothetical protein